MTREEALREADALLEDLLKSGDEAIFAAARDANGNVDQVKLVMAAMRSRERLADKIMRDATLRDPRLIGFDFPIELQDGTVIHPTSKACN